jgi:hypothetical protein
MVMFENLSYTDAVFHNWFWPTAGAHDRGIVYMIQTESCNQLLRNLTLDATEVAVALVFLAESGRL